MQLTLWEERVIKPRKRRSRTKERPRIALPSYSITGTNDCQLIGHTINSWDLLGCSTCIDCGVKVYCPHCTKSHPQDVNAIPIYCPQHEESAVSV